MTKQKLLQNYNYEKRINTFRDKTLIVESVAEEAKLFLNDLLYEYCPQIPRPNIDLEEEGYLNISWHLGDQGVFSTLIRGDGVIIFSGAFEEGQYIEGALKNKCVISIIRSILEHKEWDEWIKNTNLI